MYVVWRSTAISSKPCWSASGFAWWVPAMSATTKAFLDHFNLKSLDELPPLAALRELEPEPALAFEGDLEAPQSLQARADLALADEPAVEVGEETSFSSQ